MRQVTIINNNHQGLAIPIITKSSGPKVGVAYQISVTVDGITNTYSDTTEPGLQTVDQLGLRFANLINANGALTAIYNDSN